MKAIIRSCAAGAGLAVLAILAAVGDAAASGLVPRSLGPTTSAVVPIEKKLRGRDNRHRQRQPYAGSRHLRRARDPLQDRRRARRVSLERYRQDRTQGRMARLAPACRDEGTRSRLPDLVPAGPLNPLGARGIYLYKGGADTLYRIHGTNEQSTVGGFASSGCFRMSNADVIDLYERVKVGSTVIVK